VTATDNIWVQPQAALPSPQAMSAYNTISDNMREELAARGAGIVDEMIAERICFLYAHMRQRETLTGIDGKPAFANDRARKETMQQWSAMAEQLQRRWDRMDMATTEEGVKKRLAGAVDQALLDMPPDLATTFRELLTSALEEAGI
jgi:hypothetical protein